MKKKFAVLTALIFLAPIFTQCDVPKILVNHKGKKVIEIDASSWWDHKAHGDEFLGFVD